MAPLSTPFRLQVPRSLLDEMLAQARAELPNECCGLLAGRIDRSAGVGRVERRYPLVNEAASPTEYLSEAKSMFSAVRDMDRNRLEMLAIYHSHPTSAAVPSRKDLERSYSPDVIHLIVSLQAVEPVMDGWWLSGTEYRAAEWECVE